MDIYVSYLLYVSITLFSLLSFSLCTSLFGASFVVCGSLRGEDLLADDTGKECISGYSIERLTEVTFVFYFNKNMRLRCFVENPVSASR